MSRAERRRAERQLARIRARWTEMAEDAQRQLDAAVAHAGSRDFLIVAACLHPEGALGACVASALGTGPRVGCPMCGRPYTFENAGPALPLSVHLKDRDGIASFDGVVCSQCAADQDPADIAERITLTLGKRAQATGWLVGATRHYLTPEDLAR